MILHIIDFCYEVVAGMEATIAITVGNYADHIYRAV